MEKQSIWIKIYWIILLIWFVATMVVPAVNEKFSHTRLWQFLDEALWVIVIANLIFGFIMRVAKSQ